MFGGLMKTTSLAALLAAAGLAVSGFSAQAADLGGNCCADLEERIAELEATTARKGNRKVSLTVSGQVNQSVLIWDDGQESKAYVVDNESSRSRVRFLGSAKIDPSWSAGYLLELGTRGNREDTVSQVPVVSNGVTVAGGSTGVGSKVVDVRHSAFWINNKDLGKVWLGQTSDAADGITEITLANTLHFATPEVSDQVNGFQLRNPNGTLGAQFSALWNGGRSGANPGEGDRFNVAKYETPTIGGFIASASWGEADQWAVGLRYAGEFSGFKLAAGIAYADSHTQIGVSSSTNLPQNSYRGCARLINNGVASSAQSCDELGLSASLMHVPTGLFVSGAYGFKEDDNRNLVTGINLATPIRKRDDFYLIQAGIEQKFFPLGRTTIFGEYFDGKYGPDNSTPATGNVSIQSSTRACNFTGCTGYLTSTEVSFWGIGFNQNIEAASMDMYVLFRDITADAHSSGGQSSAYNDFRYVSTGAIIKF